MACHQVIAAGADDSQTRCLVVQRQADGVQQGGLACARGACDGKQAVAGKGFGSEIDLPLALERIEILETQLEDFHAALPGRFSGWLRDSTTLR